MMLVLGSCVAILAGLGANPAQEEDRPYPTRVTERTRADAKALAALEAPGTVLFEDGFETPESLKAYFEIQGQDDERAKLTTDAKLARSGTGALQLTAPDRAGKSSGACAFRWLGDAGHRRLYFRRYLKFAADYDQGNLNHTGGGMSGVAGTNKWGGMGGAGLRPKGDDHFSSAFEPWRDWGRRPAPGSMFLYTYWMDMKRDRDGNWWGNMLEPAADERIVPERDRWHCLEQMIQVNDVGQANGEMAAWIDGKLYEHFTGFRWRTSDDVKLKRVSLTVYVHQATRANTVWYDDVVVSTGYVGARDERKSGR